MRLKITKKKSVVEKADLIIKKDMKHMEMMREKWKYEKWESTLWKRVLKGPCNSMTQWLNDKNILSKIRRRWCRWSSGNHSCQNPHEKKISLCVCVTFNQPLALKMGVKKIIKEAHTELCWNYCGKMFDNRKKVDNHMYEACESISSECTSKDEVEHFDERIIVEIKNKWWRSIWKKWK